MSCWRMEIGYSIFNSLYKRSKVGFFAEGDSAQISKPRKLLRHYLFFQHFCHQMHYLLIKIQLFLAFWTLLYFLSQVFFQLGNYRVYYVRLSYKSAVTNIQQRKSPRSFTLPPCVFACILNKGPGTAICYTFLRCPIFSRPSFTNFCFVGGFSRLVIRPNGCCHCLWEKMGRLRVISAVKSSCVRGVAIVRRVLRVKVRRLVCAFGLEGLNEFPFY